MVMLAMACLATHVAAAVTVPAIIIIRHAEEVNKCKVIDRTPDSTLNYGAHQRCLSDFGKKHADLYNQNNTLDNFLALHNYSQITKVITIDPNISLKQGWPTSNPYFTIQPYLSTHAIKPPALVFVQTGPKMNAVAFAEANKAMTGSTLIVWEKTALDTAGSGLLDLLFNKASKHNTLRDTLYVLTNKDQNKYDVTVYSGFFKGNFADKKDLNTYRRAFSGILPDLFKSATDINEMIFCPGYDLATAPKGCP